MRRSEQDLMTRVTESVSDCKKGKKKSEKKNVVMFNAV